MSRNTLAYLGLILLPSLPCSLFADTIVLKNGQRLEATITKTTDTTVEADVKVSAGISEPQTIKKSDILGIDKPDPSDAAFEALKPYGPGPNSKSAAEYTECIEQHLKPFLAKYPGSVQADDVKKMVAFLEKDKARVIKGEVKVEYEWFTPEEVEKQKSQISATLLFQQMKAFAQQGNLFAAMNTLGEIEKTYPATAAYPDAVDYAVQLLPLIRRELDNKTTVLAHDLDEREKGMALVNGREKPALVAAANAEEARADAAIAAAVKSGIKWTPLFPRHKKSLDALETVFTAESTRLIAIQTAPMHASVASSSEAKKQLADGDLDAADASIKKATSQWAANLEIKDLTADLAAAKTLPSPTPTLDVAPTPATTVPAATTVTPTVAPPAAVVSPAPTPTAPAPTPSPSSKPTPVATVAPAPVAEEPASFFTTIPGALTILGAVAVIAGLISFVLKKKAKKAFEDN